MQEENDFYIRYIALFSFVKYRQKHVSYFYWGAT